MEKIYFNGYLWSIEDDPLCEDGSTPSYEDCRDCPLFYECYTAHEIPKRIKAKKKEEKKNIKLKGYL